MPQAKTIVMSLGGSLIAPDDIDIIFLKQFRKVVLECVRKGYRIIIICGGGNTARNYQRAAKLINPKVRARDLDWVGIAATKINAELVSAIFGDVAYESLLIHPSQLARTSRRIIVGGGYRPGHSSDKDAVLAAWAYGASAVINLSNISYVYDKDPRKFKDAKQQKEMTWQVFQKLVGTKWVPGAHVPFDPVATKLARRYRLKLVVLKGSNLSNLRRFLTGKKFIGTVIQ